MMHGQVIDISARIGDNSQAADRQYIQIRRQIWAKDLPSQVKLIALAIVEHMWGGNLSCYPSKVRLMRMVNITERAFDTHYKEAKKLFIIEPRLGKSSVFHARIERVSAELLAMFPPAKTAWGAPAESAPPPPAYSAPTPPAEYAGGQDETPRRIVQTPPAESAGRRDKEEKEDKKEDPPVAPPSNAEPKKPKGKRSAIPDEYPSDFDEFWKVYPRREGKAKAFEAWKRLTLAQKRRAYASLKTQLQTLEAKLKDRRGNFCPLPATWINQGRFDDDPPDLPSGEPPPASSREPNWHEKQEAALKYLLR